MLSNDDRQEEVPTGYDKLCHLVDTEGEYGLDPDTTLCGEDCHDDYFVADCDPLDVCIVCVAALHLFRTHA